LAESTQITQLLINEYNSCVDHANYSKCTAAHLIAKHNKLGHCRLLLEAGADFAVENKYGRSAVDIAAELGFDEVSDFEAVFKLFYVFLGVFWTCIQLT
jgi:ankyrin repeat protein